MVVNQSIINKNPSQQSTEVHTSKSHFQYVVGKKYISIHHQPAKNPYIFPECGWQSEYRIWLVHPNSYFQYVVVSLNTEYGWLSESLICLVHPNSYFQNVVVSLNIECVWHSEYSMWLVV